MKPQTAVETVEDYLKQFSGETKVRLVQLRTLILDNVPEAEESISYGILAYKLNGKPLVYLAGYPKHIGFYALPTGHEKFKDKLAKFKQGKDSVQFPLDQ